MTPAQIAKIMARVDAHSLASYHTGTLVGVGNRPDKVEAALKSSAETRAAIEAALSDAPQADWRSFIEGMEVSVDVSTDEASAENRYFGTVSEVMDHPEAKHGVILLVQNPEPNFAPSDLSAPTAVEPVVKDCLTTAAEVEPRDERAEFEAHWYDLYHSGSIHADTDGTYWPKEVQCAWEAWQARASKGTPL